MNTFIPTLVLAIFQLLGGEWTYTVRNGDSLTSIGARYGVDAGVLAAANGLEKSARLKAGQDLQIDNRHIVPTAPGVPIVINVPQRMLFHFREDVVAYYPIGAGKPSWPTPTGPFEIVLAETDPVWDVPESIQAEMLQQGKPLVTRVLPGAANPLGKYWLGLSLPRIGIHGTNAPFSVYSLPSHGCIRLNPQDIDDLFHAVAVGTRGLIIYEPVLLVRIADAVFLEAHPDAYRREPESVKKIRDAAEREGFAHLINWDLAQEVIRIREGIARDVSLHGR